MSELRGSPETSTIEQKLEALFAPWNTSHAPGVVVGVRKGGEVIFRRGFGLASIEAGTALTPRTRLRIGSTTKHMTALLALLLAEDGLIDLDLPIRHYLPELAGPGGDPSIRLLLQHRGGSRCYLDLGFIAHGMAMPPRGRVLDLQVRQQGRNFPVGEAMIYNNGGYHLVSLACERVTGRSLASLFAERLFKPLDMHDTAVVQSDYEIHPGVGTLHVLQEDGSWRRGIFPNEELLGEGAVISTVDNMLAWMHHLRTQDKFGRESTWQQLLELPQLPNGERGCYALGVIRGQYRGAPVVHHAGGVIGGSAQMLMFPTHELEVIIICNRMVGIDPSSLAERVADIVLEDSLGSASTAVKASNFPGVSGWWWSERNHMVYELRDDADMLKAAICGSAAASLESAADGRVRLSPLAIGDVHFDLSSAAVAGTLDITFGSERVRYKKLELLPELPRSASHLLGSYFSEDGQCTLRVFTEGDTLAVQFSDAFGMTHCPLKMLSESVAVAARAISRLPFAVALSFVRTDGVASEVIVNTPRTRNLSFLRKKD